MLQRILAAVLVTTFVLAACDTGQKLENQAPETRLFLDGINLSGENRLRSKIRLHWLGEDVDGYITGYEVSLDETSWTSTLSTDTVINFELPAGNDTADLSFFVRAIDNEGAVDPTPDFLDIPLKNTPPIALFDTLNPLNDTFFTVFALPIQVDDPDGINTIDSILIKANEGPWYSIDPGTQVVTIKPNLPESEGLQSGEVYENLLPSTKGNLEGIRLDEDNVFYVKSVDIAGSSSIIDTSITVFIKKKTSDLLILDDHSRPEVDSVYLNRLNQVYPVYDRVEMSQNTPILWNPTFRIWIELYDKIFWYADGGFAPGSESLLIELAANEIQNFLTNGGKLLLTTSFSDQFTQRQDLQLSPLFEFTPMDSLALGFGRSPRLPIDSSLTPTSNFDSELIPMTSGLFATGIDPYHPKNSANTLFEGGLQGVGSPWAGPRDLVGRTVFVNGETNVVFSSIELHILTKNGGGLRTFMDEVLNQYFNW